MPAKLDSELQSNPASAHKHLRCIQFHYDIDTGTRMFSCRVCWLYSHHTLTVWTERPKKDVNKEA